MALVRVFQLSSLPCPRPWKGGASVILLFTGSHCTSAPKLTFYYFFFKVSSGPFHSWDVS